MRLKIFPSGLPGLFSVLPEHAFDLVGMVADQTVDFDGFDYAGFSPLDKSPDGYTEEFSGFFLREKIRMKIHMIKLSRGIPVSFEILRASIFPRSLLLLK